MFRRMLTVFALTATAFTTPAAAHADTRFHGEGDDVVRIHTTKKPGIVRLTHRGDSNFIVHTVDPRGKTGELLVNEIGLYDGTVLYNDFGSRGTSGLAIRADGAWTATFTPLNKARCWCSATIRGRGDQVLKLSPTRGLRTMRATHGGEANFIVHAHTRTGSYSDLLINDIGRYKGKVLLPSGTRLITVHADGPWTLTRS
ncbi:hypothetical protein IL992_21270 [Microbispora sp. NEAU-D428]|uniref:hypothetical protein n=1 Tax=Microbispora sitophila TaxID=2771537 RepID=UPI00186857CA|nr:hypothetical protein [Microbispora sitophila]MBE3011712.1 hypothetical protein [Microbispora sitophila]